MLIAPVPVLAGAAGVSALSAYLNAKFHIAYDLKNGRGGLAPTPEIAKFLAERVARKRLLTYHVFEDHALRDQPNHPFLMFEGKTWTYREFFDCIIRVGNWLMNDLGVGVDELVAIDGGNSPEYLMLWFALDAIGAVPSFVNWNLTGAGLVHCAKVRYVLSSYVFRV
jgi:acyl-CoA synthetase (AMP-forming)/AMP-acid ligase II